MHHIKKPIEMYSSLLKPQLDRCSLLISAIDDEEEEGDELLQPAATTRRRPAATRWRGNEIDSFNWIWRC